jgi:hypothetical protein
MSDDNGSVSLARLGLIAAALAFLLTSLGMGVEVANASTAPERHSTMGMSGGCPQQPAKHEGKLVLSQCCIAGCIASVDPAVAPELSVIGDSLGPFASSDDPSIRSFSEVETPPPRIV